MIAEAPPDKKGGLPWPPPYTVRESARARTARLRVQPGRGLEIVIPRGMRFLDINAVLERHKDWILRALSRMAAPQAADEDVLGKTGGTYGGTDALLNGMAVEAASGGFLSLHGGFLRIPFLFKGTRSDNAENIPLPSWGGARGFSYPGVAVEPPLLRQQGGFLPVILPSFTFAEGSRERRIALMNNFIHAYARRFLGGWLASLSEEHSLIPAAYAVRLQKSRWGSCSVKGSLSLNVCLVFLPPLLCRHILLHELCHLRHMDHSEKFWKLLFSLETDALELDKQLRHAWKYVPGWIWER